MIPRLGEVLPGVLRGAGLEPSSHIWQIVERWSEIVGPRVAQHASPAALRRGELVLAVPEATWRQELSFLAPEIARRVNQELEAEVVNSVRLNANALPATLPPSERRNAGKPAVEDRPAAHEASAQKPGRAPAATVAEAVESLARARAERSRRDRSRKASAHTRRTP
jgi:hypothetical protein